MFLHYLSHGRARVVAQTDPHVIITVGSVFVVVMIILILYSILLKYRD